MIAGSLAGAAVVAVALYVLLGGAVSEWVAARFAGTLEAVGQGKFSDPVVFVHERLEEAAFLSALVLALAALDLALWPRVSVWARRTAAAWAVVTAVVFVQINGVAWAASQTALFWLATWQGEEESDPATPFALKRILAGEEDAEHHVVLLGNSQVASQVEEAQIARRLGDGVWVTELGYMGAEPFDLLLLQQTYAPLRPVALVVYLSEISFYRGVVGMRYPVFMDAQGQADFVSLGGEGLADGALDAARRYARVARALPLYAVRAPVARRVLGAGVVGIAQDRYAIDLIEDLDARAEAMADAFTTPGAPSARFQKRALETLVQRSTEAGATVVLLAGGVSPLVSDRLDPALRADFLSFLEAVEGRHPLVHLVREEDMPSPPAHAFRDLTHVTEAEKQRGTREMLPALVPLLQEAVRRANAGRPRAAALGSFPSPH